MNPKIKRVLWIVLGTLTLCERYLRLFTKSSHVRNAIYNTRALVKDAIRELDKQAVVK